MKPPRLIPSTRTQAALLLSRVLEEGRTLDDALVQSPPKGESTDVRFVMMLVLIVLRHLGQLDVLISQYVTKPLPAKRITARHALRLGAAQLLMLNTPAHAATNETVQMVKFSPDSGLIGLINAVMMRIEKDKPALPPALHNIPAWLRSRWEHAYGADAVERIANISAERPPLDLVCLPSKEFATGARLDSSIWRLPADHGAVTKLEGYDEGEFWVQDVAATYPVRMLGAIAGLNILDIGAAPGGKTSQLAKAGAVVTALDKSASRMETLKNNLARLRLSAKTETADMLKWEPGTHYDVVLLDAPCSATGTWRRHPEVLAITTQHDITELARQQREMLKRAWHWVKPGGRLLYCVCSLETEEGEAQAAWFLTHHTDAALVPAAGADIPASCITPEGTLRALPSAIDGGMDGFFAAIFRKH